VPANHPNIRPTSRVKRWSHCRSSSHATCNASVLAPRSHRALQSKVCEVALLIQPRHWHGADPTLRLRAVARTTMDVRTSCVFAHHVFVGPTMSEAYVLTCLTRLLLCCVRAIQTSAQLHKCRPHCRSRYQTTCNTRVLAPRSHKAPSVTCCLTSLLWFSDIIEPRTEGAAFELAPRSSRVHQSHDG